MKKAVYPGSFDPITYGHIDIAKRALKVFERLTIVISVNPNKSSLFTPEERVDMVREVMKECIDRVDVVVSNNLTVKQTKELGASHIVRGLRAVTDFEYEFQMTHANRVLEKGIDSIFFMTDNFRTTYTKFKAFTSHLFNDNSHLKFSTTFNYPTVTIFSRCNLYCNII